jgi:hypothetical protein
MPEYLKIGNAFHLGEGVARAFFGPVVASADAFYLVVQGSALRGGAVGAGPFGASVADWIERRTFPLQPVPHVVEMDLAELRAAITGHPDWPIKAKEGPVIVVWRQAIKSIGYSFWKWRIYLLTVKLDIGIEPPLFGRKKVWRFLDEAGWEVEA